MVSEMVRPFNKTTALVLLLNCALAAGVTKQQGKSVERVWSKMTRFPEADQSESEEGQADPKTFDSESSPKD